VAAAQKPPRRPPRKRLVDLTPAPTPTLEIRVGAAPTLELTHERVDDVPLLLGFLIKLRLPETIDRHLPPHPLHRGLSNGWLITVWIAYILSQADHRKSHVQQWVENLRHTIETLIGRPIRPVEFGDDRLTLVLRRLSPDLPQIKLMAAAAEPSGLFLAGDVHPGNAADDPLYLPLYRRVRELLGQAGLLYAGDCEMAAL
jgi:transposase